MKPNNNFTTLLPMPSTISTVVHEILTSTKSFTITPINSISNGIRDKLPMIFFSNPLHRLTTALVDHLSLDVASI